MNEMLRLTILSAGGFFFVISLTLLIRKKLNEKIAIIWFFGIFAVLILSIFPQWLNQISDDLGVDYPPSLLYLIAILILFFYNLYQSIKIVEIQRQVKEISQVVSLSQHRSPEISSNLSLHHTERVEGQHDENL